MEGNSFTHVLVGDVEAAISRLKAQDNPTHRRELVKAVFSAIEGLNWKLRQGILRHSKYYDNLGIHEIAALSDETFSVSETGVLRTQTRFIPLRVSIRLAIRVFQSARAGYEVDFSHNGWSSLITAIELRNRLVHPKKMNDLEVTEDELSAALHGFHWFLALVIEVLEEQNTQMKEDLKRIEGSI